MESTTLKTPVSIGELRDRLKYRSRESMNTNWSNLFNGELLPDDHLFAEPAQVLRFVRELSVSKRGRPGTITGAAQRLLKLWEEPEVLEEWPSYNEAFEDSVKVLNQPEPIDQPEEKSFTVNGERVKSSDLINFLEGNKKVEEKVEDLPERKKPYIQQLIDLSGLDLVYLVTIGFADYGLIYLLKEMGFAAALVYSLVSLHALGMAKNRKAQDTARTGLLAVWVLEILAFFIHLTLFNLRLWDSIKELPFPVDFDNLDLETRPFWIATVFAFLFSATGIYAVTIVRSLMMEAIEAEQFERTHNVKY